MSAGFLEDDHYCPDLERLIKFLVMRSDPLKRDSTLTLSPGQLKMLLLSSNLKVDEVNQIVNSISAVDPIFLSCVAAQVTPRGELTSDGQRDIEKAMANARIWDKRFRKYERRLGLVASMRSGVQDAEKALERHARLKDWMLQEGRIQHHIYLAELNPDRIERKIRGGKRDQEELLQMIKAREALLHIQGWWKGKLVGTNAGIKFVQFDEPITWDDKCEDFWRAIPDRVALAC